MMANIYLWLIVEFFTKDLENALQEPHVCLGEEIVSLLDQEVVHKFGETKKGPVDEGQEVAGITIP